jgi:hypothetical protein
MRAKRLGLLGALGILIAVDVVIARVDVLGRLAPASRPTSLLSSISRQLVDVASLLSGRERATVVLLGNSQMEAALRPLGALRAHLVEAGAPADVSVASLCVFATAPTDAEALSRHLGRLRPQVAVLGMSAPDLATPPARARDRPLRRLLDVGWRTGPILPADFEERLDRAVRSVWHLYRYRQLLRFVLFPPDEPRTPASRLDATLSVGELLAESYGPERGQHLLGLRGAALASGMWADVAVYVDALRGEAYRRGLHERWRGLEVADVQVEALRRFAANTRAAGVQPVWVLLPENAWLESDPVVGSEVARRSDAVAARVRAEAERAAVPFLDLRAALGPDAFLDLNHLAYNQGALIPALAAAVATAVEWPPSAGAEQVSQAQQASEDARRPGQVVREQDQAEREEVEGGERGEDPAPRGRGRLAAPAAPQRESRQADAVVQTPEREVPGEAVPQAAHRHGDELAGHLAAEGVAARA